MQVEEGLVDAIPFYTHYKGHPLEDLAYIVRNFRVNQRRIVWLVGDSSLDNKHWLFEEDKASTTLNLEHGWCAEAINGYEQVLRPPRMVKDVCYWVNTQLVNTDMVCVNAAVEEACIKDSPSAHDGFVLSHLKPGDFVIISIGGNDLILKPSTSTLVSMGIGTYLVPDWCLDSALAWFPNPLYDLFVSRTQEYVDLFFKASRTIVCTPYFPCSQGGGWASRLLDRIDMNKAQTTIRAVHNQYHKSLKGIFWTIPLYEVLDYECEADYKYRVEPSVQGGRKMGQEIANICKK